MISPEGACRVSPSALGARDAKAFVAYSFAASLPADGAALVADPAKWYNVAADAGVFTYHAPLAAESAEPASGPRRAARLALSLNGGADWSPAPIAAFYATRRPLEALHLPAVAVGDAATVVALGGPFVESTGWTASVGGEAAACSWLNGSPSRALARRSSRRAAATSSASGRALPAGYAVSCNFFDAGVSAGTVEAVDVVACAAPPRSPGPSRLSLSLNGGADWVGDAPVSYGETPTLSAVAPAGGSFLGGREVLLRGRGFAHFAGERFSAHFGDVAVAATVVDDATLSCIAPSRTVSETVVVRAALGAGEEVFLPSEDPTFDFHANPVVTAIHPAAGTARGGNALVVVGSGFADGGSLEVRLTALDGSASVTAAARFLNASAAVVDELPASPLASGDGSGRVFATATNCGDERDLAPDPASAAVYAYEGALAVTGVAPGAVDAVGGTVVTVSGFGFFPTRPSVLSCKFGTVAVPATFLNETAAACRSPGTSARGRRSPSPSPSTARPGSGPPRAPCASARRE
ncbi:hypothetical protein JL720_13540 [Aureococcus anophagefferens]|nr:hypothetical protein JL720_13540 [Aureococcus anophagefferens]